MKDRSKTSYIIIGGSAGSVEALEELFSTVRHDDSVCFIVIQHWPIAHKSIMDEILSKITDLPITIIEDDDELLPGHIYMNPSDSIVRVVKGRATLHKRKNHSIEFPINEAMISLAAHAKERAIGIVLTGTGSDGTEGIKAIKEHGGMVLVQDPKEASFAGMPENALKTGLVDHSLPIHSLYERCLKYLKISDAIDGSSISIEDQIDEITTALLKLTGFNFSDYKKGMLERRISRRMGITGYEDFEKYKKFLLSSDSEAEKLKNDFLIGVTKLFRDEEAFVELQENVIKPLVQNENDEIRIWIAACSTGEEAYSIAILVMEEMERQNRLKDVSIFATDLDPAAIKVASQRTFNESIKGMMSEERLQKYFIASQGGYQVKKMIRDMIIFSKHNFIKDTPYTKIDLVSCRNFLIYLDSSCQEDIFLIMRYILKDGAYLFLGPSESLGKSASDFVEIKRKWKIFKNKKHISYTQALEKSQRISFGNKLAYQKTLAQPETVNKPRLDKVYFQRLSESIIQRFAPPSLVFNSEFELLHVIGEASDYLKIRPGKTSSSVLNMLPESWSVPVEVALRKLKEKGGVFELKNLEIPQYIDQGKSISLNLELLPSEGHEEGMFILSFGKKKEISQKEKRQFEMGGFDNDRTQMLEKELRSSKERLQSTIEELSSANEELQSSNEEMQSSNEELQSLNEELFTVNSEYQKKVDELANVNSDLENLMTNTDVGTLFLDHNLILKRFTYGRSNHLSLSKSNIGLHISEVHDFFSDHSNLSFIQNVLDSYRENEKLIELDGNHLIFRVRKMESGQLDEPKLIITLIDVTNIKEIENQLVEKESQLEQLQDDFDQVESVSSLITKYTSDLVCVHKTDGTYEYVSPSCKRIIGYEQEELIGKNPDDYCHKNDLELLKNSHEKIKKGIRNNVVYRFKHKKGHYIWVETTDEFVTDSLGEVDKIITSSRDVTEKIEKYQRLDILSSVVEDATNMVIVTDVNGLTTYVNNAFIDNTGYKQEEVLGKKPSSYLQGKETSVESIQKMSESIQKREPVNLDVINYKKNGEPYWSNLTIKPLFDHSDELIAFFSVQKEITQEKESLKQIESLNKTLQKSNNALTLKNKELQEYSYAISHDLKEPIRSIHGILGLIERKLSEEANKKVSKHINIAKMSSRRLGKMIDSLLAYSRTASEVEELKKVDLFELNESIKNEMMSQITDAGFEIQFESEVREINAFPRKLYRVFQNLISNAIKFRQEDGKPLLKINVSDDNDYWLFEFKDNGKGIEKESIKDVFKIFNKVNIDHNIEGHGIGLASCRRIIDQHQGSIEINSEIGEGTQVVFRINKTIK